MPDALEVLLEKAVSRAAAALDISEAVLTQVVVDEKSRRIFVKLYLSLVVITGDDNSARGWMNSENLALSGRPLDLIWQPGGLEKVSHYLMSFYEKR